MCIYIYIYISVIWRQTWFWTILMDVSYATIEIQYGTLLALARSLLWYYIQFWPIYFKRIVWNLKQIQETVTKTITEIVGERFMMKVEKQNSWALKRLVLNIKSLKGRKTSYFPFYRSPNQTFLGLRLVLQPERSVCLHKVLLIGRQIMSRDGWCKGRVLEEGWLVSATLLPRQFSSMLSCHLGPVKFQPFSKLSMPSTIQRHLFSPHMSCLLDSPHLCSLHHKSTVQAPPAQWILPTDWLPSPPLNGLYPTVTTGGTGQWTHDYGILSFTECLMDVWLISWAGF